MKFIGAEAILVRENSTLLKKRIKKGYRIKQLDDRLRKKRTKLEAKLLKQAKRAGVPTPRVIDQTDHEIKMEYIDGQKVKDILNKNNYKEICKKVGENIARLHSYDIIHGDLTTSNMILKKEVFFIDFGLGFISVRVEDKATDLHLLRQALEATHTSFSQKAWKTILDTYSKNYPEYKNIINTMKKIELRGRYKTPPNN